MTKIEIKTILESHALWLSSEKEQGKQADFSSADLEKASFKGEDLRFARFNDANCKGADFTNANCEYSCFESVNFSYANFQSANFENANCENAQFRYSVYKGANFTKATLKGALFDSYFFNRCKGNFNKSFAKGIMSFNKINGRDCYAVNHITHLMILAGCFWGNLNEFEATCLFKYPDNPTEAYQKEIAYLRQIEKALPL